MGEIINGGKLPEKVLTNKVVHIGHRDTQVFGSLMYSDQLLFA
ncbi:hypothetical protein [Sphingobacterium paucimobilis]|nr:hypothetical protein [Sphingobacterium paucimobilis]